MLFHINLRWFIMWDFVNVPILGRHIYASFIQSFTCISSSLTQYYSEQYIILIHITICFLIKQVHPLHTQTQGINMEWIQFWFPHALGSNDSTILFITFSNTCSHNFIIHICRNSIINTSIGSVFVSHN